MMTLLYKRLSRLSEVTMSPSINKHAIIQQITLYQILVVLILLQLDMANSSVSKSNVKSKRDLIQSILGRASYPSASVRSRIKMMEAFKKDGLVPDVVDAPPLKQLRISYGTKIVEPGMVLTPTDVKDLPVITFDAEPDSFYTLIMNDPDAPSRADPKFGEWHHWLVVNIPGGRLSDGETMAEYVGAGPPPETGLHRYVFLLYKQPAGKMDFGLKKLTNRSQEGRAKHSIRDFLRKSGLSDLVAGNFFLAKYDDYVPELYKQLSG